MLWFCLQSYSELPVEIMANVFHNNSAIDRGGVLYSRFSIITIGGNNFTNNVSPIGAVIYATDRPTIIQLEHGYLYNNN